MQTIPKRHQRNRKPSVEEDDESKLNEFSEDQSTDLDDEESTRGKMPGGKQSGRKDPLILQYKTKERSSNYHLWAIGMKKLLAEKYRNLSRFLNSNPPKYWVPEILVPPPDDELTKEADPHGFKADDYRNRMKVRYQIIVDMEQDRHPMFATILNHLGTESTQALEALDQYEAARSTCNVVILWNLIKAIHQSGTNGGDADERFLEAVKAFAKLEQGPDESLKSYKNKIDAAIANIAAINTDSIPSAKQQAIHFTKNLDSGRYGYMQSQARDASNRGDPLAYAKSLTEAHNIALHTQVLDVKGNFVAADDNFGICAVTRTMPTNKQNRARGKRQTTTHASTEVVAAGNAVKSGSQPESQKDRKWCKLCGAEGSATEGHWMQDCPRLGDAKAALQLAMKPPAVKATVNFADGPRPPNRAVIIA